MKNKKYLASVLIMAVLMLAACGSAAIAGGGPQLQPQPDGSAGQVTVPQVSVVGSGLVYVTPDIAYINVGVRSQADSVSQALALNNDQANAIKVTLMDQGVDEKDIQTSSFNVYPQSDYDYQGAITRSYFVVENNVYVSVRNLDTLGNTLDAVAKSGANTVYGITFDVLDKTAAQSAARKQAVDAARALAQELADAAGVELGDILSISTISNYTQPYYDYGMGGGGAEGVYAGSVPIAAGKMQINADVTMVFVIKQASNK